MANLYISKPRPSGNVYAAQFNGTPLDVGQVLDVAQHFNSTARVMSIRSWEVLVVDSDMNREHDQFYVLKKGQWLVYSIEFDLLYVKDDLGFNREYGLVNVS